MNIMIFLSYVLFPMMVMAIMLLGPKGVQAAGAYAMFTISTQMWLPVAAVINYFIQLQVINEISAFGSQDLLLNAYNAPLFYEKVSTKLALASDMISAIPLLCMSIFTGSMFATTRIAERWGGRDYYDEKVNSPEPVKMDAVANAGGFFPWRASAPRSRRGAWRISRWRMSATACKLCNAIPLAAPRRWRIRRSGS